MSQTKSHIANPYLTHIVHDRWNDLNAYHVENVAMWRNIAIITIIIMLIITLYSLYLIHQNKHQVVVFERNQNELTVLGIANKTLEIDNKLIMHHLGIFIIALRESPLDTDLKKRNINIVHNMISHKLRNQIDQILIEQYSKTNHNSKIIITLNNLKPLANTHSWQISWSETYIQDVNSNHPTTTINNWSTIVTFKILQSNNIKNQLINPIGLYITYLNPTMNVD